MQYTIRTICDILSPIEVALTDSTAVVRHVCTDSRKVFSPQYSLFVALGGKLSDGHKFIAHAYEQGVRTFLVRDKAYTKELNNANVIVVNDVLEALQTLATEYRHQFDIPTVGITGSNGKTILKEWLYQMLYDTYSIVKSPKSYNSQVGVPLSLFQIEEKNILAIFEAGISMPDEMIHHAKMIAPTIGIFTNIGDAHEGGFDSRVQKIREKALLFSASTVIIYCYEHQDIRKILQEMYPEKKHLTWSKNDIGTWLSGFKYSDQASQENMMHCITMLQYLGHNRSFIKNRINTVSGIAMRLEMKKGLHESIIINDAYSADLSALTIALEFLNENAGDRQKMMILSALEESCMPEREVIERIQELAERFDVQEVHYISPFDLSSSGTMYHYHSKGFFLEALPFLDISRKAILVKGARSAGLESIVHRLAHKGHSTKLTINLTALEHNVRTYQSLLKPETGVIAVIKAGAYGSGAAQIAQLLHQNGVRYLAVAFVDEAIHLRNHGVTMPIIVFNADIMSLRDVVRYELELEVYTEQQLVLINEYGKRSDRKIGIHLKIDTGMHRLGFLPTQIARLTEVLTDCDFVDVKSIFSHLASSESEADDAYTFHQFEIFDLSYEKICAALDIRPMRHILNSSGITRFRDHQYELVRLGLGLYGIDGGNVISKELQKVHSLTSNLLQVKQLKKGDSIGYNRRTILTKDSIVGVVNIGYADGLMRNVGNLKYAVHIRGYAAPIVGTVSMDLIIVDLSEVPCPEMGERVVVFDHQYSIEQLAEVAGTIPYEILSRISERVDRLYVRL